MQDVFWRMGCFCVGDGGMTMTFYMGMALGLPALSLLFADLPCFFFPQCLVRVGGLTPLLQRRDP